MISTDELFNQIEKYLFAFSSKEDAIKYIFNNKIDSYTKLSEEEIETSINDNLTKYFKKQLKDKKLPELAKKYVKDKTLTKEDISFLDSIIIGCDYEFTFDDLDEISNIKEIEKYIEDNPLDDTFLIRSIKEFEGVDEITIEDEDTSELCSDMFKLYKKDISRYEVLDAKQQKKLMRKYKKTGDADAFDKLVYCNQGLCISWAKKYMNRGVPLLDLIQEGNIGLIKGIELFDLNSKTKVSTYVTWWIRQAITNAVNEDSSTIRIPKSMKEKQKKIEKIENSFAEKNGRMPTIEELKELTGFTEKQIKDTKKYVVNIFSIDREIQTEDDNGSSYKDFIESDMEKPNETPERIERVKRLNEYLKRIGNDPKISNAKRVEQILRLRLGPDVYNAEVLRIIERVGLEYKEKYTLNELGMAFHLKGERIRQLAEKGLNALKRYGIKENFLLENGEKEPEWKPKYKYKSKKNEE